MLKLRPEGEVKAEYKAGEKETAWFIKSSFKTDDAAVKKPVVKVKEENNIQECPPPCPDNPDDWMEARL